MFLTVSTKKNINVEAKFDPQDVIHYLGSLPGGVTFGAMGSSPGFHGLKSFRGFQEFPIGWPREAGYFWRGVGVGYLAESSNEIRAPSCLGDLLGMTHYTANMRMIENRVLPVGSSQLVLVSGS